MSCVLDLFRARPWPRAATLALMTLGVAGCSSESTRFAEGLFSFPNNAETTASIPATQVAPSGQVESQPLPPHAAQPPTYQSASVGSGTASRLTRSPAEITGSVNPKPAAGGHWTWEGGTPIIVAQGDTIDSVARRHGVPATSIIQANNLTGPVDIHAGQHLVIPRYRSTRSSAHRPKPATAMSQAGNPGVHVVASGETLSKIGRLYGKPAGDIARANNIQANAALRIGDRLVIPGVRSSAAKPKGTPASTAQAKAETEISPTVTFFTPATETVAVNDAGKSTDAGGALPKFRWPANGRVITGYGPTSSGQRNDGINIALPENTPIKAAEDGVVAYAGNELKGYGNLVLVRHPNGYVTAYAHAKELLVKRGDQIKRGQVIARSGQTGNVNAPQLHFEVRKGASPLDPMKFLGG